MTRDELTRALGIPARQIRFLISEGILPPAKKTGRAADAYDDSHLACGQRYLSLHRMGMKPASIKILMSFESAIPIMQRDGVELRVDPQYPPEDLQIERILIAVEKALKRYSNKD